MLHGTFELINNSKSKSLLFFPGVGGFEAYSGNKQYRNQAGCTHVKDIGPLPVGKYWIVNRPTGSLKSEFKQLITKDVINNILQKPSPREEWFALYRDDGLINDSTYINQVQRTAFRLHPRGFWGDSYGCITVDSYAEYKLIHKALLAQATQRIPNTNIITYGTITVYAKNTPACP